VSVKDILPRGLIVSCQALEDEPLHSSFIMGRMALAAKEGGAIGIRANSFDDIVEIKKCVSLPVIGIVKREYDDSEIYISATFKEIEEVVSAGAEIVALDATNRKRPEGEALKDLVEKIREKFPQIFIMADISTYEEGREAERLGFDIISTTLSGYTLYTKNRVLPDIKLIERLCKNVSVPVIAEGGIWSPEDLKYVFQKGVYSAVVGTAITRPKEITQRFVKSINELF
jgi:N-acylglucosamine-6-phosphate 2-epimerase